MPAPVRTRQRSPATTLRPTASWARCCARSASEVMAPAHRATARRQAGTVACGGFQTTPALTKGYTTGRRACRIAGVPAGINPWQASVRASYGARTLDPVALQQPAGDHEPLDLVGALADDHERRVAVVALDAELLHVAVAAEDAHGLEGDLLADLGGEELRHARLEVAALAAVLHRGRLADEEPRRLDLGGHVGELELDRLVLADGLAERPALLRVADGVLEGRLRHTDRAGGDVDAPDLEAGERDLEPQALPAADQVLGGHDVVLEDDLAGLDAAVAELVEVAAHRQARALRRGEHADPPVRGIGGGVGLGEEREDGRGLRVGDEHLGAVHHVVIAPA